MVIVILSNDDNDVYHKQTKNFCLRIRPAAGNFKRRTAMMKSKINYQIVDRQGYEKVVKCVLLSSALAEGQPPDGSTVDQASHDAD